MRALRPMTQEERDFAEQKHNLVIQFLHCKCLPMDDYYDIVIFGYLSAVQQYIRNPPAGVEFKAMAFRAMKDAILRDGEYHSRSKRNGVTVSLDDVGLTDPRQDTEQQVEGKALLERWGLPQELEGVGSLALGYGDCPAPAPKPRKEGYIVRV